MSVPVVHRAAPNPERPGEFRWFMATSGMVYGISHEHDGYAVFSWNTGALIRRGFATVAAVVLWSETDEDPDE